MTKHAVFYTDGSAKPIYKNTYKIGWGVHGYLYEQEATKPVQVNDFILTDRGYVKKTALPPGYKAIEPLQYLDALGSCLESSTNNVAELSAVLNIISKAKEYALDSIMVFTDSEYVKKGILDWMPKWLENNWTRPDGTTVANVLLWKMIHLKLRDLTTQGIVFNIEWIKAHDERLGNVQADLLASIGVNYSFANQNVSQFDFSDPKGYWKTEVDRHPLLNFNRVYFNSMEKYNTPGHYYQADPGGNDFIIGKRLPETGYSIVRLTAPDPVIESVKQKQYQISKNMNAIFTIKLDTTHHKTFYPYINKYGVYSLYRFHKNNNIVFIDDQNTPITFELNPTGLSLRAIDSLNFIEEILDSVLALNTDPSFKNNIYKIQQQDITEIFYDTSGKKTVLRGEYIVGFSHMSLDAIRDNTVIKIPYILGTDCPTRNHLKRLETLQPKITLVTFTETENTFRYCTVIECENAQGIWSNFYADKVLL